MKKKLTFLFALAASIALPFTMHAQAGGGPLQADPMSAQRLDIPKQDTLLKRDNSQPWTLQECIAYAQVHNITVQQQQLNVQLAQATLLQSQGAVLPSINGVASHTYQYGRTIDRYTNTFANSRVLSDNFFLTGNVTLFSGLQNYNTIKQSRYSLEANRFQVQQTQYDIGMNVASAYLNVLFTMEQLDVATQQADLTRKQVDRMQKLVDAGAAAKGSLLDLQAQLATEEVTEVSAQNSMTLAYLGLTQLMNLDSASSAGFSIVKPNIAVPNEDIMTTTPEQIYQTAISIQPAVKKAQMDYQSADRGVAVAYGALSPSITLQGSIGTGYSGAAKQLQSTSYNGVDTIGVTGSGDVVMIPTFTNTYATTPFATQINNNVNKSVGVQMNIPIFNRFQVNSSIERAKIQRQSAELNVELTEQQLFKSIQQAYADARAAFLKYQASQKAVDAASESFKYTEERFNIGSINSIDYNNIKNKLAKAQSDLVQAKYDYIFRMKVLDYYQGKPLTF